MAQRRGLTKHASELLGGKKKEADDQVQVEAEDAVDAEAGDQTGPEADEMREKARAMYHADGEVEIDDNATISWGGEPGAYVQAWVWVPFDESEEAD